MRAILNKYLPRSRPESFDQCASRAFLAALTAASTSFLLPRAIELRTSSVAGLIVGKCFSPATNFPPM